MKSKKMKTVIVLAGILILVNIPPIRGLFRYVDHQDVDYSNMTGTFTFSEMNENARSYDMCLYKWGEFKKTQSPDTQLYRITPKNYLQIWNYGDYLFAPKYQHPYKSISLHRPTPFLNTGFQDF